MSCVRDPIIAGKDHELILHLIHIPELHIHLGITNRLVKELNTGWSKISGAGKYPFYKWANQMNIQSQAYWSVQVLQVLSDSGSKTCGLIS